MWNLKLWTACVVLGAISLLLAAVAAMTGGSEKAIFVLSCIMIGDLVVYSLSVMLWETVFIGRKMAAEREAADSLAEDLRKEISRAAEEDERFPLSDVEISENGSCGLLVEVRSLMEGERYMTMFVRVSLSHLIRHYGLCVPYEDENVISYFHFFQRENLIDEMKRELGLFSERFK